MKNLILMILLLVVAFLTWGVETSRAQHAPASASQNQPRKTNFEKLQDEAAAKRAEKGQMRSLTPSQRKAAAARLKAKLDAEKQQGAPTTGKGVTK